MKKKGLRWWVIGLIALAAIINYIDRQAFSVLWEAGIAEELYPDLDQEGRKKVYGKIGFYFIIAYALGQALFGRIFDKLGTRIGFVLSIGFWSLATALHALVKGFAGFTFVRALLGLSEAGNWPGAAKANAEWFPTNERAVAQGIFNFGASFGAMISIPVIGLLAQNLHWQLVFLIIALLGFLWLIPWMIYVKSPPKKHPWITDDEKEFILSGQENEDVKNDNHEEQKSLSYGKILGKKQSWGVILASAAIDPIWWIFVIWIPNYLVNVFNMDISGITTYGWIPFLGAMIGAPFGGLLAKAFFKKGWSVNKVRKMTIGIGCVIMLPALLALSAPGNALFAVLIMAVILFGFQTAIGNIQTLPSDLFNGKSVGTLSGLAGMSAKFAAAGLTWYIADKLPVENYSYVFLIGAALVGIVFLSIWLLIPKIQLLQNNS
ncbi:MFS transporter [uncultured Winogradskyella sp.]|uniref:MFS transporter n=1 Tax=uncultured Winogradskyella sp. TaxID=395353 RepID=UPI0026360AAE|nr:MFS transporter [uncultured Winogradskyella sp.]